jgi:DNA-binding NarL/FixJ family response regulator
MLEGTVRIFVIEDNEMERGYLWSLLNGTPGVACGGAFGKGDEALDRLSKDRPDVILIALKASEPSDFDWLLRIHALAPRTPVLLLSPELNAGDLFRVLEVGVSGLLEKPCSPDQIVRAIMIVNDGGAVMSAQVARRVLNYFHARGISVAGLTAREREVLNLLAQGQRASEIASRLGVSSETIRTHLRNILDKMHVHSRFEAVAKYLNPSLDESK